MSTFLTNWINRRFINKNFLYDSKIEYLESSGTQYIDTNIFGDHNTKVVVRMQYFTESSMSTSGRVFGSRTGTQDRLVIGSNNGKSSINTSNFAHFDGDYRYTSSNIVLNSWVSFELSVDGFYINGQIQGGTI